MKQLVTVAATRPMVALALGYVPFLALAATLVVLQSGWSRAGPVMAINTALVLVPLGCVWLGHRLAARARTWWKDRLLGAFVGLLLLFPLVAAAAWFGQKETLPADGLGAAAPPFWLLFAGLITAGNAPPLLLGVLTEAVARRLGPRAAA